MNTVASRVRARKLLAPAAILCALGLAALLLFPPRALIAWAATPEHGGSTQPGAPPLPLPRPTCAQLPGGSLPTQLFDTPTRTDWHAVTLPIAPRSPTRARIGRARVHAHAKTPARHEILWRTEAGASALIIHSAHVSQVHTFTSPQFQGRAALSPLAQPDDPIDSLTLCFRFALTVNKDINTQDTPPAPPHDTSRPADRAGSPTTRHHLAAPMSTWRAYGTITIDNLTPLEAALGAIGERTQDGVRAEIDCGVPLPGHILRPGASLRCQYALTLPSPTTRQTTLTVRTLNPRVAGARTRATIDFHTEQR